VNPPLPDSKNPCSSEEALRRQEPEQAELIAAAIAGHGGQKRLI
jgi:hypothetical protein